MSSQLSNTALLLATCGGLGACQVAPPGETVGGTAKYDGVETKLLDDDLVNFQVRMSAVNAKEDLANYADCAAAQYALIRGYGFARHVRTNVTNEGGIWRGDAVYTISPALPEGLRTIDAEVTVQNCASQGIPTV